MKYNTLYNKVKNLAMVAVIAPMGAGMLAGCSDFLDVEPQNVITLEQFWNEETDVKNIIAGCYSGMASYGMISRMMIWGEFRSENVINNGSITKDVNLERILKENIMANNGYTNWQEFYNIINRCNTVMEYAPGVAEKDPSYTQSELKADIAEVTAIRALCYFYLIRTFRDVPYSEEAFIDDSQQLALPATPFDEVLDKLIASLEAVKNDAITKYPEASGLAAYYNTGRVTKKFIHALLCEMYLWKKDYQKCIDYADLIIEEKKKDAEENKYTATDFKDFNGYPLIASKYDGYANTFGQAFSEIFVKGNSMESIFELNFDKESGSSQISNGPASDFFGGQGRTPWVTFTTFVGNDQKDGVYKVFAKSNNGLDARAYENINFNNICVNKHSCASTILYEGGKEAYKKIFTVWYPTIGSDLASQNKSNYIIYRLTDIMLLKAEALTQLMSDNAETLSDQDRDYLEKAFDLVDAVNKRSLMQTELKNTLVLADYGSKTAITNLVYEERNRELMFEGKRFFDLVRRSQRDGNTDYLRSNVSNKSVDIKSTIESKMQKMDAIYWPYNLDEIKANPNLKQNSAFGSGENSSYEKN